MVLLQNSRTTIIFKRSYSILMTLKLKKLCIEIWMTLLSNIFSIRKRIDNGNPDFFILSDQTYTHFPLECLLKPRQSGASNQKALFLIQNGMSIFFLPFLPFFAFTFWNIFSLYGMACNKLKSFGKFPLCCINLSALHSRPTTLVDLHLIFEISSLRTWFFSLSF